MEGNGAGRLDAVTSVEALRIIFLSLATSSLLQYPNLYGQAATSHTQAALSNILPLVRENGRVDNK